VELATCRVPIDHVSPAPAAGHAVACSVFYEQGFAVPSHRFFFWLLQFYGLELHHLTPLGILHIATFITMCKAYMVIEPHLNLWNDFFRIRLWSNSYTAVAVWGCIEIYVRTRPGIIPYFHLSISNPSVGWQKEWFLLRNNATAPLPVVTGKHPTAQLSWGYGVAKKDTRKLQLMHDILHCLL
jgi:hypothetical protein